MKHSLRSRQRFSNRVNSLFVKSPETCPARSAPAAAAAVGACSVPTFLSPPRHGPRVSHPFHWPGFATATCVVSRRRVDDLLHTPRALKTNTHIVYNVASQTKFYRQRKKKITRASDNTAGLRQPLDERYSNAKQEFFTLQFYRIIIWESAVYVNFARRRT